MDNIDDTESKEVALDRRLAYLEEFVNGFQLYQSDQITKMMDVKLALQEVTESISSIQMTQNRLKNYIIDLQEFQDFLANNDTARNAYEEFKCIAMLSSDCPECILSLDKFDTQEWDSFDGMIYYHIDRIRNIIMMF